MVKFLWTHPMQEPVSKVHEWHSTISFLKRPVLSTWHYYILHTRKSSNSGTIEQKGPLYLPEESCKEYLQVSYPGYSTLMWHHEHYPQEPQRLRWPQERSAEQSALTNARHTYCASGQLGTTADWRYEVPGTDFEIHAHWQGYAEEHPRPVHAVTNLFGDGDLDAGHHKVKASAANEFVARKTLTIASGEVQGTYWNRIKCKECFGNPPGAVIR
jgi:hypothetical protein